MKSTNTLVIKEMRMKQRFDDERTTVELHCELLVELQFVCPVTGYLFKTMTLSSSGAAYSDNEAARRCIQAFLDGVVNGPDTTIHGRVIQCMPHNGVDHLNVLMPEPLKSLFIGLFDPASWSMPGQAQETLKTIDR